jgi:hypothetical protein
VANARKQEPRYRILFHEWGIWVSFMWRVCWRQFKLFLATTRTETYLVTNYAYELAGFIHDGFL